MEEKIKLNNEDFSDNSFDFQKINNFLQKNDENALKCEQFVKNNGYYILKFYGLNTIGLNYPCNTIQSCKIIEIMRYMNYGRDTNNYTQIILV
ncbi:hypothetical protein [Staphylococcus petrasii]|uniref:hypothetical protein n=1 Tax=Staphylococcus petrasii TaxID=1276936 RepID=UPI003F67751F